MKYSEYRTKGSRVQGPPAVAKAMAGMGSRVNSEKPVSRRDYIWYLEQLRSNGCLCGKEKKAKRSFCYHCFSSLPYEMRQALYLRMGEGYEAAFEEAHRYLTENVW